MSVNQARLTGDSVQNYLDARRILALIGPDPDADQHVYVLCKAIGISPPAHLTECAICETVIPSQWHAGRPRRYCSTACAAIGHRRRDAMIEDVEWLLDQGTSAAEIVERIGLKPRSVHRVLLAAGRSDLAARFSSLAWKSRQHACADCEAPCDYKATRCRSCAMRARHRATHRERTAA